MTSAPARGMSELLPPDPSVPGMWWVHRDGRYDVWHWHPAWRTWSHIMNGRTYPASACAAGWRLAGPAVPPPAGPQVPR